MQGFDFRKVWAVARAERRLTRRLKRYWLFLLPAYVVALGYFFYLSMVHGVLSSFSASIGMVNPRYLAAIVGFFYLMLFIAGVVFLSFDVRARDQRERIAETVDSRPLSNLELLGGRFLGLFLSTWIPILVLCLLLQGVGMLLPMLGSPVGTTVEPWSLIGFAVFLAIPALCFAIGLVFFLTLLLRNRLLSALLAVGAVGGLTAATLLGPYWSMPYTDFLGSNFLAFASDILPGIAAPAGWLQRAGFLMGGLALVALAAAAHPRLDGGSRGQRWAAGGGMFVLALALLLGASLWRGDTMDQRADWRLAHEARAGDVIPDMQSVSGAVSIAPGQRLDADLEMTFSAPPSAALDHALFSLNPGLEVASVTGSGGQILAFTHAGGLLDITLPASLPAGQATTLRLRFGGLPDVRFGYLDSPLVPEDLPGQRDQAMLGVDRAVFDARYVALMPGIYWLPLSGVDTGRYDPGQQARDVFDLALEVEVPEGWLAAGPGKRREPDRAAPAGRARFRFAPVAPLPEAALMTSRFIPYARRLGGIDFEVLLHPEHTRNLAVLAPIQAELERWVEERLALLRDAGLDYPYEAFTLVETPNSLLGYRGGWRVDTAMAPPAMALLRESGFPTARFDFNIQPNPNGGIALNFNPSNFTHVDLERLRDFFTNDMTGSSVFTGIARSLFSHQVSAAGPEAAALDFVMDNLAHFAVADARPYFSPFSFNQAVAVSINGVAARRWEDSISEATINHALANVSLWNQAMDVSLVDFDPWVDAERSIDLFTLKGGELAKSLYHALGAEGVARVLASLRQAHAGGTYTLADVRQVLEGEEPGLGRMFEDMLLAAGLPGFVVSSAEIYRLPDGAGGDARYQLLLAIRNDEPVPGYLRIGWFMPEEVGGVPNRSDAIRIDGRGAVEFGLVLSQPPARAILDPYLSRNWSQFVIKAFDTDTVPRREVAALDGVRSIAWEPDSERIVVDDLDPGFQVLQREGETFEPAPPPDADNPNIDNGLLVSFGQPPRWSRNLTPVSWGTYRHTYAVVRAGKGDQKAVLPASLPRAGIWDLELHFPDDNRARGTLKLEIVSSQGRETLDYNTTNAIYGWNLVGQYELPAGEVRIEVSDDTDAAIAVADAFAWTPVGGRNQ